MIVVSWDYKEQPDVEEINSALEQVDDPKLFSIQTGDDSCAVVIAPSTTSNSEAQNFYNENQG